MLRKLWNDDSGIVALEYLLLATIVGLGLVVGLSAVEAALNVELTELSNAITALDQGYQFDTNSNDTGTKAGNLVDDVITTNIFLNQPDAVPANVLKTLAAPDTTLTGPTTIVAPAP